MEICKELSRRGSGKAWEEVAVTCVMRRALLTTVGLNLGRLGAWSQVMVALEAGLIMLT